MSDESPVIDLLRIESIAIEEIIHRKAALEQDEKQIIADIARIHGLSPETIATDYLITSQGLIRQSHAKLPTDENSAQESTAVQ
jgi:hypothetical protein